MIKTGKFKETFFHQRLPWGIGLVVGVIVVLVGIGFYRSHGLPLDLIGFLGLLHAGMGFGFFSGFALYLYLHGRMKS